ncbi:hypothetical protein [Streptomyces gibsoniae]|uniref:Uncharacterized protein n=1 Tax=Streptomyces gibsoniae TaxID=3075529 RepID=A0ABU2TMM2_9ACTN|nr:hypothetical protein [Streptomyces sp. DSM 41699]MDT0462183.1 hypothetical protein [Streptomyces sp. DSM 41699]
MVWQPLLCRGRSGPRVLCTSTHTRAAQVHAARAAYDRRAAD